jgi:hypothetical protein
VGGDRKKHKEEYGEVVSKSLPRAIVPCDEIETMDREGSDQTKLNYLLSKM